MTQRLVIVGGFPRAGTRQFTDFLNAEGRFTVMGEIEINVFKQMAGLFSAADETHEGRPTEGSYRARRRRLALEVYGGFSKVRRKALKHDLEKPFVGFKSPRIEIRLDQIKTIFKGGTDEGGFDSCDLFICLRNAYDNFLSLHSAFGYSQNRYTRRTVEHAGALKKLAEDPFFRVHPLDLDDFIAAPDKAVWIGDALFGRLGLSIDVERRARIVEESRNRNKTPPEKRKTALDPESVRRFLEDQEFMGALESIEGQFGCNLRGKLVAAGNTLPAT